MSAHAHAALGFLLLAAGMPAIPVAPAAAQEAPPPSPPPAEQFFEEKPEWSFRLGTDTTLTLSDVEDGSKNQTNDRTTPFDPVWARLYGKLAYGDRAELVADVFATDARSPRVYGLYGRVEPRPWLGVRAGVIPLVASAWQERAYPHLHPLVNAPLLAQYLLSVRNDSIPASPAELLSQKGFGGAARFSLGKPGSGAAAAVAYEHCWPVGAELLGQVGPLRYRVAATEGPPAIPFRTYRQERSGPALQARVTWKVSEALRLGVSGAQGPYLFDSLGPLLPSGTDAGDYDQQLASADLRLTVRGLEVVGEWNFNRFESPYVPDPLDTHAWYGEASYEVVDGLRLAARLSGLDHRDIGDGAGGREPWEADALRVEAGAAWRFFEDGAALKAVYQRTRVDVAPRTYEDVLALQLSFSR